MDIFQRMIMDDQEQVVFCHDAKTKLKAIVAIHNTTLGPALGGTRIWPYKDETEALIDVLRLARGMTYKNAAAGLPLGGGKAVILLDPAEKTEELMEAYGRFIEGLNGRYVTAADMNTTEADMQAIRRSTSHVTGLPVSTGGSGSPSTWTALGVFCSIEAAAQYQLDKSSLEGVRVAVQGLGSVGFHLCKLLHEAGAELIVADINEAPVTEAINQFGAKSVSTDEIHTVDADIFSPCARGAVINNDSLSELKCRIIAGAANNQLLDEKTHSQQLRSKGILYAPDFIVNAGGVINISFEVNRDYSAEASEQKVKSIYDTLLEVFQLADTEGITTLDAAMVVANRRLAG